MITFNTIYPTKNQVNVGVNEDIKATVSASFELDLRNVVFKIHGVAVVPEIYSVYYGDSTSELDITLYTKRRIKYASERRYGQDNLRYGMRDVFPSILQYGSRYVVQITVFGVNDLGEEESQTETFTFSTEEGVFANSNPRDYYYSDMTQSMANFFPEWSKSRYDKFSNTQQLLNPIGNQLETISDFLARQNKNTFIQTCNLNELGTLFRVELGKDYPVQSAVSEAGETFYVQPDIRAIQEITEYDLFADQENSMKSSFKGKLPTRLGSERSIVENPVIISDLKLTNLAQPVNFTMEDSGCLFLVFNDIESTIYKEKDRVRILKCRVSGIDIFNKKAEEDVLILENRIITSTKEWKYIDSLELVNAKEEDISVSLYQVPPTELAHKDFKRIVTEDDNLETVFWKLSSRQGYSLLEKHIEEGENVVDVLRNAGSTKPIQEYELFDIDNLNRVNLVDCAIDNFSNNIYGIDNDFFYVFDKRQEYPTRLKEIPGTNGDADFLLEVDSDDFARDEAGNKKVLLKCIHKSSQARIVRYRIKILTPSGAVEYLLPDGSTTVDVKEGFIPVSQNDIILEPRQYELTLNESGQYILELETLYQGGKTSSHRQLVEILRKSAKIKYKLERILDDTVPLSLSYYCDQKLKIYDSKNILNTIILHKDSVVIDYEEKILYFNEDYSSVEVEQ